MITRFGMSSEQATLEETALYTPETLAYVSQTRTETTITRTTTITTVFPSFFNAQPRTNSTSSRNNGMLKGSSLSFSKRYANSTSNNPNLSDDELKVDCSSRVEKELPATPVQTKRSPEDAHDSHFTTVTRKAGFRDPTLRKTMSHSALSLVHASLGTGATPAVPTAATSAVLSSPNVQTNVSRSERPLTVPPNEISTDFPGIGILQSPAPRKRQRGLSLFTPRSRTSSPRTPVDGRTSVAIGTVDQTTQDKENDSQPKRPLLWRLRVPSFSQISKQTNREASNFGLTDGITSFEKVRRIKRPSTAPSDTLHLKRDPPSTKGNLDVCVQRNTQNPLLSPSPNSHTNLLKFSISSPADTKYGTRLSDELSSHQADASRNIRRRSNTIAVSPSSVPEVIGEGSRHSSDSIVRSKRTASGITRAKTGTLRDSRNSFGNTAPIVERRLSEERQEFENGLCLKQLLSSVSKSEALNVLAASSSDVQSKALLEYMDQYDFSGEALDIALRMMLAETGLPKETQQIDRVLEAFARRYCHCNPEVFTCDGQYHILTTITDDI